MVLHLAQSEEAAAATAAHGTLRGGLGAVAGETMDERADAAVTMERPVGPSAAAEVFARWQRARQAALAALRARRPGAAGAMDGAGAIATRGLRAARATVEQPERDRTAGESLLSLITA